MKSRSASQYLVYPTAVIAPVLIGLFMTASWPLFIDNPVSMFLLAVIISAWLGGLYPGLLSLAVSLLVSYYFFMEPYYGLEMPSRPNVLRVLVIAVVGTFISFGCEWLRRERGVAESRAATIVNSDARLSGIIDSAMDAIVTIDSGQKIVLFNAAAETMFKCTAADAVGEPIERFIPERFRGPHAEHVRKFGETHVTTRSMRSLGGIFGLRSDGEEFPIEASISQLETHGEKFFTVILRDISERKLAEEEVRASELRYRRLFEAARDGIFLLDVDTLTITDSNPYMSEILGYTRGEFLGKELWQLGFFEDKKASKAAFRQVQKHGYVRYDDIPLETKGGDAREVEFVSNVYHEGGVQVIQCNIRDITERKAAEERRIASDFRYRRLFESTRDGILIMDAETGMVMDVNPFLIELLGFSHEEFLGKKIWELGFFKDIVANQDNFAELQQKEYIRYEDMALETNSGRRIEVEFTSNLYLVDHHKVIQCDIRDISGRKQAEDQIRNLNAGLEQRVLDRTEQLEAANNELESFSYSVSHDLRAPLRHIDGFVQLLTKREVDRLDDTSGRYLKIVSDAVRKMGTLIDELLAFSRTSRVEIKTALVDLNTLIAQAKTELAPAMTGRKIKWQIHELPLVTGDPVLLSIVMTNLLSNAIKYTRRRDEAHIEIGMSGETESEATIFVKDDGAGFDMKYVGKLFGVFQRLHREDEFEGIGIGLATVQRIIHRHGGKIWPESELDKGTTFYMTLKKAKGKTK